MFVRMLLSVDIALMLEDLLYSNACPSSCSSCETSLWCKRARSAHEGVLAVVLEHGSSVWRKRQDTDLNSELRQTHVESKSTMRNNCSCPAGHHMSFSSKKSLTIQEVRVSESCPTQPRRPVLQPRIPRCLHTCDPWRLEACTQYNTDSS